MAKKYLLLILVVAVLAGLVAGGRWLWLYVHPDPYTFNVQDMAVGGNPLYSATPSQVALPADAKQAQAWEAVVKTLTSGQGALCDKFTMASERQFCQVKHLIFAWLSANKTEEACAPLYIDYQRQECQEHLKDKKADYYLDADKNGLLDFYENQVVIFSPPSKS